MVTHRYQDGNLLANFRYNPERAAVWSSLATARGHDRRTTCSWCCGKAGWFSKATRTQLEASRDPYMSKFVKQRE